MSQSTAALLPADLEHCDTCICDHTSARAVDYAKRVAPIRLPLDIQKLAILTRPEAIADVLGWYKQAKAARGFPRPELNLVLVAHADEIEVRVKEIKVRTYCRRNTR